MFKCFSSYRGWGILALAIAIGGYLAIWHGAHVDVALPFLVILVCPLMHMFMHGGHGHHHGHGSNEPKPPQTPEKGK